MATEVTVPMVGKIVGVNVKVGDSVSKTIRSQHWKL